MLFLKRILNDSDLHIYYLGLIIFYLSYFTFFRQSIGDESDVYYRSLLRANFLFPKLDLDPIWTISTPYTWLIVAFYKLFTFFDSVSIIISGRLISSIFYLLSLILLIKDKTKHWLYLMVLSNPYVLIYATRAHPYILGLFFLIIFVKCELSRKYKFHFLFIPLAVNFQVYFANILGFLLRDFSVNSPIRNINRYFIYLVLILLGFLLTYLTWGSFEPSKFQASDFYKEFHSNAKLTFGYFPLIFSIIGLYGFFFNSLILKLKSKWNLLIAILIFISLLIFIIEQPVIGLIQSVQLKLIGKSDKVWLSFVYIIFTFGWFRINQYRFFLLISVLFTGIILCALPYLYERIAVFSSINIFSFLDCFKRCFSSS